MRLPPLEVRPRCAQHLIPLPPPRIPRSHDAPVPLRARPLDERLALFELLDGALRATRLDDHEEDILDA